MRFSCASGQITFWKLYDHQGNLTYDGFPEFSVPLGRKGRLAACYARNDEGPEKCECVRTCLSAVETA